MKNHLSMLGSIGPGALSSPWGMLRELGSAFLGEAEMVVFAL